MQLEDARRRNRRRITALASVALLNHWIVASVLAALFSWGIVAKFTDDDAHLPLLPFALGGGAAAALIVAIYTGARVLGTARSTVRALGAKMTDDAEHLRLRNLAEELAIAAGIEPVTTAVLDDPVPNALTVGAGRRCAVVVTTGLLAQLSRDELEAVLAVQMCAIRRLDVALQTMVVAGSTGAVGIHRSFRDDWKDPRTWPWIAVTWPSNLLARWVRRKAYATCDMGADDMAVAMTRHPDALRRALMTLLADPGVVAAVTPANAPLWFEPVPEHVPHHAVGRTAGLARYSMAPSIEDRIARLSAAGTNQRL